MTYLTEIIMAFILAIVTGVAGILVKHYYNKGQAIANNKLEEEKMRNEEQRKEYERLLKEEQARNHRQMILDEIEPLVEELNRVKDNIVNDENDFAQRVKDLQCNHDKDKYDFDEKITTLIEEHEVKFKRIRESYKFRFIQLCKTYLKDGGINTDEWEQLVAMYELYEGLGGNGQAKDYFDQVKKLRFIHDYDFEE